MSAVLDRDRAVAEITVTGPDGDAPASMAGGYAQGAAFWPLAVARELDDLILDLRTNETEIGTWVFRTVGDASRVLADDALLLENAAADWLVNEIVALSQADAQAPRRDRRSLIALIEPGSCFAGLAARAGPGGRPVLHARRRLRGRRPGAPSPQRSPSAR